MVKKTTTKKTTTKKTTRKPAKTAVKKPAVQKEVVAPEPTETVVAAPETPEITLKDLLMLYNSVTPSRRRWIQNRNTMRNHWKELFQMLEKLSGRTGQKVEIYDYNWHEIVDKGGVSGLGNLPKEKVTIVSDEGAGIIDTSAKDIRIAELELQVQDLKDAIKAHTQAQLEAVEIAENGTTGGKLGDDEALPGETPVINEDKIDE